MRKNKTRQAFSLVELIVVIVIIGILAAIAIPRFSRGASNAGGSGVRGNLAVLRNAIELYYYEHGEYPGKNGAGGTYGDAASEEAFTAQLVYYTDADGAVSETKTGNYIYGPYLRKGVPACPVAPREGKTGVHMINTGSPAYTSTEADAGWVFNYETGDVCVNSDQTDPDNVAYDEY